MNTDLASSTTHTVTLQIEDMQAARRLFVLANAGVMADFSEFAALRDLLSTVVGGGAGCAAETAEFEAKTLARLSA